MIKPLSLVYKAVREFNPDVIHVHNIMPQYLLSPGRTWAVCFRVLKHESSRDWYQCFGNNRNLN